MIPMKTRSKAILIALTVFSSWWAIVLYQTIPIPAEMRALAPEKNAKSLVDKWASATATYAKWLANAYPVK